jgi:hypothetical protein
MCIVSSATVVELGSGACAVGKGAGADKAVVLRPGAALVSFG